ncbi:MAG TPA: helix-turn-helix domain-containing protein [Gaiellaceae bacterium]|nr:helix-turn-helix domain-containing protein [Gaiellaceae bacterium]
MDRLEAVGDRELRATLLLVRARAEPVTADEVAEAQGIHRNVARFRLERLVEAGLLSSAYERRSGRSGPGAGRPAKTYGAAPELRSIAFPDRRYETLLRLVLDAVPARGRTRRLRAIGAAYGDELARGLELRPAKSLRAGIEAMCAAVRSLGFQASVEEVGDGRAVIATPTCPLRPLVREYPDAAEIDRGMWSGLAAHALTGVTVEEVECETRDCLVDHASCRVHICLRRPAAN